MGGGAMFAEVQAARIHVARRCAVADDLDADAIGCAQRMGAGLAWAELLAVDGVPARADGLRDGRHRLAVERHADPRLRDDVHVVLAIVGIRSQKYVPDQYCSTAVGKLCAGSPSLPVVSTTHEPRVKVPTARSGFGLPVLRSLAA